MVIIIIVKGMLWLQSCQNIYTQLPHEELVSKWDNMHSKEHLVDYSKNIASHAIMNVLTKIHPTTTWNMKSSENSQLLIASTEGKPLCS